MYSSTTQTFITLTTAIAIKVYPHLTDPQFVAAPYPQFVIVLEAVPVEDWCRTWPAERTIMLRMTSKRVKEVVDKMRPPAVVRLCRKYWDDFNSIQKLKLKPEKILMRQLLSLVDNCKITTLSLEHCNIDWVMQDFKKVLDKCPELNKLDLSANNLTEGRFVDALMQCSVSAQTNSAVCALTSLNLAFCNIGNYAAVKLANELGKLPMLSCLNLKCNYIGVEGAKVIGGMLGQCKALTSLNLGNNEICNGAINIVENLPQCSTLTELDLSRNYIDCESAMYIAENLLECVTLAHFDLSCNWIGPEGVESITRALKQCSSLTCLNLEDNKITR